MDTHVSAPPPPSPPSPSSSSSSSSLSSSSINFTREYKYRFDVFLSFRGKDTRHCFTLPLYEALRRKGINVFIDDKKLGKGEEITSLFKAIKRSRISIIVFSRNYATSRWCLDELTQIIRCKNEKNQQVMPIFYKVDPDVRFQRDSFEAAIVAHEDRFRDYREEVQNWRSALSEAASLSEAWIFKDGYEAGSIERFVEDVYAMLPRKRLHGPEFIVGLEPQLKKVISLLNQSDNRVCMLGIHGIGGIGKTTLVKLIYNSIFYKYEGACFLFDVKQASKKYRGIVHLQQQLLYEILDENIIMSIGSVYEGISRIKHRLSHKKVLLVLDDVDETEQLEQLAGASDWFGYGSTILITTRDKQLLNARNVEKTYEMMKLNEHHSLELFCWHAFRMKQPPKNCRYLSRCALRYAQGLPLALSVVGSNLVGKNLEQWRSILEQYEKIQEGEIHKVLKISYDCLQYGAKRLFLDIACLFDENMLLSAKNMVEACDFGARFYLEVLFDKSLIAFDHNHNHYGFIMHDLIRQMGREIVGQEAPLNPNGRSRLWKCSDVLRVLHGNPECNNIEAIKLDPPKLGKIKWNGKAFEKMNSLRILIIRNVQFSTGPTYLPNSLRWLEWEEYPSATLPAHFSPSALVFFKLPRSSFGLKEPFKIFTNYLIDIDFRSCEFITEIPDISQLQSLRRLDLAECRNLVKVHESVGSLSKLVRLDLSECSNLSNLPFEIKMTSLRALNLRNCRSLKYFPIIVGRMDALELLSIEGTAVKELPPCIANFRGLQRFVLYSCKSLEELPTSLFTLQNLSWLDLGGCHPRSRIPLMKLLGQDIQPNIGCFYLKKLGLVDCGVLDEELHLILTCFRNLEELFLSWNDFVSLPKCIKECSKMKSLHVNYCKRLRDIPELPSNLSWVLAQNCPSLTAESFDRLYFIMQDNNPSLVSREKKDYRPPLSKRVRRF